MKASVITPVYNHSKYLRERIESILCQTFRDFELILLDDCSTDGSRSIIEEYSVKYPCIRYCFNESNSGSPFSQWNKGVNMASGEFIWIAESDDSAAPDFLEKTAGILERFQDAGMVFTDSKIVNEQKGIEYLASERNRAYSNDKLEAYFNNINNRGNSRSLSFFSENPIVNVSGVLFRKSKYLEAGGADSSMKFCGDWMLYLKIFLISEIKYIPEPLNIFRLHSDSSYHSHYKSNAMIKEKIKVFSHIARKTKFSPPMVFLLTKKTCKSIILRLLNFLKIDSLLHIEHPRRPRTIITFIFPFLSFSFLLSPFNFYYV